MASIGDEIKRLWRTGGMTVRLIGVNLAVFVAFILIQIVGKFIVGAEFVGAEDSNYYYFTATSADLGLLLKRPWTLITFMFAHAGFMHILFNMIMLWFIGRMFEGMFGARKMLATYFLGSFMGVFLLIILSNVSPLIQAGPPILGASAAVFAIIVGYATYFPDQEVRLLLFGTVKFKWIATVLVVVQIFSLNGVSNIGGSIGHLGGALYGFLLITQMRKGRDIGMWFEKLLDRLVNLFRSGGGSRMKVVYNKQTQQKRHKTDEEYNAEKNAKAAKVDKILDKISKSGWDSLTKDEKDFLNAQK
ncbi:rhomboid family intramembrane serine protease [Sanyastnella coralliicola]|uniref:rhomboid family intramembrane serine protease n=1 Tax=Sanyastnella coralliicola TaxID=3069118 RepID=UPI0027B95A4D|nr:rhomboid family intramembrane serine protease [Longitalea sp. SCSIO 12813]